MTDSNGSISVVIPVFNSENLLRSLIDRLMTVMRTHCSDFEIILINDGSTDKSWHVILDLAASYPLIRGIDLMRNYGQHNALLCGVRAASKSLIVTIDDDLQHPPEEIPKVVRKLEDGYDIVYGVPAKQEHGVWRDLASLMTKLALQAAMGAETARQVSAFRAFRTNLRDSFSNYQSSFVSLDVLLTWGSNRFSATRVKHDARPAGVSNYTFRKLVTHAANMMTGFSTVPLQFASFLGFLFTLFGIAILAFVLIRYLYQGSTVPGFPFLASIIAIFSGVQLFALGIIGEYLARMHFRTLEKPAYAIRRAVEGKSGD